MYQVLGIPAFQDNYIWLIQGNADEKVNNPSLSAVIVDPGDAKPVLDTLRRLGITPSAIFLTHHHWDHIGGVATLVESYGIPVYGPARERIIGITHDVKEGDRVRLHPNATADFGVFEVPGHTTGHIAYYGHGMLFCGDTLFAAGCGRLFEGTAAQMFNSLSKLARLPEDTQIYCAHEYTLSNLAFALAVEPENKDITQRLEDARRLRAQQAPTVPSNIALEKLTNPFLRCQDPAVKTAAEHYAGQGLNTPEAVFTILRRWKDHFHS